VTSQSKLFSREQGVALLESSVLGLAYDFTARRGTLFQEEDCCCDMSSCIAFFTKIDPRVVFIQTRCGDEDDTSYALIGGRWVSRMGRE
jgi:hypothetical protein